jgi:hypothetical protein
LASRHRNPATVMGNLAETRKAADPAELVE